MDKHPRDKLRRRSISGLLILIGICLFAGGLLGPAVADLMPANGFAIANGSPDQGFLRIVPAEDSRGYTRNSLMLLGFVLHIAGMKLRRRGR
jgi:hypothetical protein